MRVALITMPWGALNMPSLALSTLAPVARGVDGIDTVDVHYGNLRWADRVADEFGPGKAVDMIDVISEGYFVAAGEWVFSAALWAADDPTATEFYRIASAKAVGLEDAVELYRIAPGFIESYADELVDAGYDVFAFTSTFLQTVPSLALATAIKQREPDAVVVIGGANCDGVQGAALHRNFPVLDHVVRGEGEHALRALLQALVRGATSAALADVPGLCWRDGTGGSTANPTGGGPLPMSEVPPAEFAEWFRSFGRSAVRGVVSPRLVLEGSRGCWWGAKHHCTFCGLNGDLMDFRSKPADRLFDEIVQAAGSTRVLDVSLADNILDMGYLRDLMPRIAEADLDLRIFCEIKSNLDYDQLETLARGNVTEVQPGIENLSSRVLTIMRKGVTGVRNVEMMRNARTLGLEVAWNYLFGFPGEEPEDYTAVLEQADALVHLQPPSAAFRVALERFSPYFDDRSLGIVSKGPAKLFSAIYSLPVDELADLIYLFESERAGISGDVEQRLVQMVERWRERYPTASLRCRRDGEHLVVVDARDPAATVTYVLEDPLEVAAYSALFTGRSITGLRRALRENGFDADEHELGVLVRRWADNGLVYTDAGRHVAVATGSDLRAGGRAPREGTDDADTARRGRNTVLLPLVGRPEPVAR